MTSKTEQFWPQGHTSNNVGKGPLDEATYKISKALVKKTFKVFPLCKTSDPVKVHTKYQKPGPSSFTQAIFFKYKWPLGKSHFWPCSWNMNNLSLLNKVIYQIWKACAPSFRQEDFKSFFFFPYMSLCKTREPQGRAIFDPGAIIWSILAEAKLHTKYQRPVPPSFRGEDFKNKK